MADDYIKRSDAINAYKTSRSKDNHRTTEGSLVHIQEHNHILRILDKLPAADVVEVVRCSKCQHGRSCVDKDEVVACLLESEWDDDLGIDYGIVTYHSNNHYCGYGERRSE